MPPDLRTAFTLKVYGLLCGMLVLSCISAGPFVLFTESTVKWIEKNSFLLWASLVLLLAHHVLNACAFLHVFYRCGGNSFTDGYVSMFKSWPAAYVYCATYPLSFGLAAGYILAQCNVVYAALALVALVAVVVALIVHTACVSHDQFCNGTGYIVVVSMVLVTMFVVLILSFGSVWLQLGTCCVVLFCGFIIVHEALVNVGAAFTPINGSDHPFEYTLDLHVFAALNIYLDFINIFFYLMRYLRPHTSRT